MGERVLGERVRGTYLGIGWTNKFVLASSVGPPMVCSATTLRLPMTPAGHLKVAWKFPLGSPVAVPSGCPPAVSMLILIVPARKPAPRNVNASPSIMD